jgi:tRNA A-37 threonylcarbamoyl transferase component Bud32
MRTGALAPRERPVGNIAHSISAARAHNMKIPHILKSMLQPGIVIDDKYRLVDQIGKGSYATTFAAIQLQLNRKVVLKLQTEHKISAEIIERTLREAKALNLLQQRNVVQFYGYGIWSGLPYVVMEYLDGERLDQKIISQNGLSVSETLNVIMQLCDGLSAVHANGIVHRDVKPANVVFSTDGEHEIPKLVDFGLIKVMPESGVEAVQRLTTEGMTVGTVAYMSPEQCRGEAVDARTDIYSLGCIMHHCLTGQAPFTGEAVAVMYKHVGASAARLIAKTRSQNADRAVHRLQEIIDTSMAKNPNDRYQSAAEMEQAIDKTRQALAGVVNMVELKLAQAESVAVGATAKFDDPFAATVAKARKTRTVLILAPLAALLILCIHWCLFGATETTSGTPGARSEYRESRNDPRLKELRRKFEDSQKYLAIDQQRYATSAIELIRYCTQHKLHDNAMSAYTQAEYELIACAQTQVFGNGSAPEARLTELQRMGCLTGLRRIQRECGLASQKAIKTTERMMKQVDDR